MNKSNDSDINGVRMDYVYLAICLLILLIVSISSVSKAANINGTNYRNVTIHTSVNLTNSKPEVLGVNVYQETNASQKNITLNAGSVRNVTCNASLRDWNGYSDIITVNATLWDVINSQSNGTDNNNTHYTNTNCTNSGNGVNYTVNYLCVFPVYYYSNNGTWNCNVTAIDNSSTVGSAVNSTIFYPLYALNITDGVDFGNVAVEDFSVNVTANITNFGNLPINVTVEGYGAVKGDGLAMNCSLGGNITVGNERFSTSDVSWTSMTSLNNTPQMLTGYSISKQNLSDTLSVNATYWQLFVNSTNNPGGNCSGYIIFSAQTT